MIFEVRQGRKRRFLRRRTEIAAPLAATDPCVGVDRTREERMCR